MTRSTAHSHNVADQAKRSKPPLGVRVSSLKQTFAMCWRAASEGLRPDPRITVSEWADKHRMLARKSSAEPGPWRTDRTPYLREIMDCLSPRHPARRIVFRKGSQIGGTECGNNWLGHIMATSPGPIMLVQPTVLMAQRNAWQRIQPMIDECPALQKLVGSAYDRNATNTALAKDFPGGMMVLTGANSATGLRSMAAKFLFLDEVDAYPVDVDGEGDPIDLVRKRLVTFARHKLYECSTPLLEGLSNIDTHYAMTDQRRYYVPCPECKFKQELVWAQFRWQGKDPTTVRYECINCSYQIQNHEKEWMLPRGEWRATAVPTERGWVGFHLPGFYSPVGWLGWEGIVSDWLAAQKSSEKLQVFVNTVLAETWKIRGEAPEWRRVYERREPYRMGRVPKGVLFLTAGADVQADRIEVEIVGWCRRLRSYSVDYRVLRGDTAEDKVWAKLTDLLQEALYCEDRGPLMRIRRMAVDSGYRTQEVYRWARGQDPQQVMVSKGSDAATVPVGQPSYVDVKRTAGRRAKTVKRGLPVWILGVGPLKSELYGWLRLDAPTGDQPAPTGFCYFPEYGEEYFRQLTAEHQIRKIVKGRPKYVWESMRERNEGLDNRVGNRAAAYQLGMDQFEERHWKQLEEERNTGSVVVPVVSAGVLAASDAPPTVGRRVIRSSFMDR